MTRHLHGIFALLLVTLVWGTTFPAMKDLTGISLQTWGQSRTTANEAAVVYAFEPAAAAFFGFLWLGEALTARGWLGGLLLISGMIVSQWNSERRPAAALAPE